MDDNAQVSSVQQEPIPVMQAQVQPPPPASQQVPRPVAQPGKQPISAGHAEMGPVGAFVANEEPDDNDDDEQPVAPQEVSNIKMSHPEVIMPQEVKDAGVTEGQDAKKDHLPEEKQKIEETVQSDVQSTVQQAGDNSGLPMSLGEAQLAVKKERSITNGISWIIRQVIREWKKRMFAQSEDKNP
jgi:hypothetical protein